MTSKWIPLFWEGEMSNQWFLLIWARFYFIFEEIKQRSSLHSQDFLGQYLVQWPAPAAVVDTDT